MSHEMTRSNRCVESSSIEGPAPLEAGQPSDVGSTPHATNEHREAAREEARSRQARRSGTEMCAPSLRLLTPDEAAMLLRKTRAAIYAMVERDQLPSPHRIGRRLLFRQDELLDWLDQKRAPLRRSTVR